MNVLSSIAELVPIGICRFAVLVASLAALACGWGSIWGQDSSDIQVDGWHRLTWRVSGGPVATRVTTEQVTEQTDQIQRFQLINNGVAEHLQFVSELEPSLLHDEYTAEVRVQSTVPGLRLGLAILLPRHIDPRTRRPLQTILRGESVQQTAELQTVRVATSRKAVEAQLRLLRSELNRPEIGGQEAVVIGLVLLMDVSPGETFFDIGSVRSGPVIKPSTELLQLVGRAGDSGPKAPQRQYIPLDVELNSMLLNRSPVVLRMAPDHGEHAETLRQLGLNAVWVPDFRSTDRARDLHRAGFAVVATPPHPEFEPRDFSRLLQSLPPLDMQCPHVSAWYTGTRISSEELPHLLAWSREVRSADRRFQRLQMADVTGAEGAVAREIDLVGIGRHVVGREETFGSLRNLLIRRQKGAGQLSFAWMWIQTEPSSSQRKWRTAIGATMPHVEPEQIQLQILAALSAGYKGFGFWKTRSFEIDNPLDRETLLAIELAGLEVELLEPLLARGRLEGHLTLQTAATKDQKTPGPFFNAAFGGRTSSVLPGSYEQPSGNDAAVIGTDGTTLILATIWDAVSQYVPDALYEREVSLVVAASETASAWQISPSDIRRFPREVTAGGLSLKLKDLDRSAALVVTSDLKLIQSLEQKVHSMAERVASRTAELASLKYLRVLETVENLREVHAVPSGTEQLLSSARQFLDRAEFELSQHDYRTAALHANDSLRILRQVQQACWKDAIAELTCPTTSPHAISFATLPEHWRLMHYLEEQSSRLSGNLLPSGNFESQRSVSQEGWTRVVPEKSRYSAAADVLQDERSGRYLRLVTWQSDPSSPAAVRDDSTPMLIATPAIGVEQGDVLIVTGRVRKGRTSAANQLLRGSNSRPLIVFDSELGPECGLRPELGSEWSEFRMIRPIAATCEFTLTMAVSGQAEIHVDDLRIQRLPAAVNGGFTGKERPDDGAASGPDRQ